MSSSITTEAFQENTKSKAYGSEQIQVKEKLLSLFIVYDFNVRVGEMEELLILQGKKKFSPRF